MDKSLVRLNKAGRYELHELLRQFADEKLHESNQALQTHDRHFDFFLELAQQLEWQLFGSQQLAAYDRLETEHDNFRAALHRAAQIGDTNHGLQLAGALGWFWHRHDYWREGREWLQKFLTADHHLPTAARVKALHHILELGKNLGDDDGALYASASRLAREVGDLRIKAWLLCSLGFVGDFPSPRHRAYLEEALVLFKNLGDMWGCCETLARLATEARQSGDFEREAEFQQEAIRLARQAGDKSILSWLLTLSACSYWYQGIVDQRTENLYREGLALFWQLHNRHGIVVVLHCLGKIARVRREYDKARTLFKQSLKLALQIGNKSYIVFCLVNLGELLCVFDEPERSARILGAVSHLAQVLCTSTSLMDKEGWTDYKHTATTAHAQLGEASFSAAFAEGQRMSLDQVAAYAIADTANEKANQSLLEPLTGRELEVLRLVADGLSNREIAERLFIAISTVKWHINEIYDKLDVKSRTQAVREAKEARLLS